MFFKIIVLKKFQNSQESTCAGVFFNKVAGPQNCNFIKKRLQHRFSLVKFAKFLRTLCFTELLQWLLLTVSSFQPAFLLNNRLLQRCFSVNFANFLRASFEKTPPNDCFLCLSVNFEKFFRTPLGNCLFHVQVAEFQPRDTVKNYFTGVFQAFYTRTRSSHSKAYIYLKSQKLPENKLICNEVARCQPACLQKNLFMISEQLPSRKTAPGYG